MEATFDLKQDRKSVARRSADLIVRRKNAYAAKAEVSAVEENGGKPLSKEPETANAPSVSPDQRHSLPVPAVATSQWTFGKVKISLENLILPDDRLYPTPSMLEGLDSRTEWHLRRLGCDFIQHAGILLKLPQVGCFSGPSCVWGQVKCICFHILDCYGDSASYLSAILSH